MAPSTKNVKKDPGGNTRTDESDATTASKTVTQQELDLVSDSDDGEGGAGAGIEWVLCSYTERPWFQPITTAIPASEANKSMELHILGAHGLSIGGGNSHFAALVSDTLAKLGSLQD